MPVDKFGRRGIEDKSDVSFSFINKTFLRRDGGNTVTGSIDVGGNTFHNVDIPRSGHEVATKAYVDSNSTGGPRKIFSGYVPPLLSSSGVTSLKTGFIASASSVYGDTYIPSNAFNSYYVRGNGSEGEWATDNVWNNFWIQVEVPDLVRVWKVALRGRDSNEERIYNWRLEGSIDGQNYTTIFTPPNPAYLGNIVQNFPIDTVDRYIYFRLYCLEAEPSNPGLSYMQLFVYSD